MRIVQTFWTAGQDPLKHSFGWLHPEYNLMSWALSCLSLREHYDEVALYTDSRGKEVLIDLLHLPYTEVNVVYDDFKCLPQHWALAKIKTYSLQTKPFLHIDGDVYLPKPIDPSILDAPLIAQNREIGTEYYRKMVDKALDKTFALPNFATCSIKSNILPSYNMGLFGGKDLLFIKTFCDDVLKFTHENFINDPSKMASSGNYNVMMEQIFFALACNYYKKKVTCLICKEINDNGYTSSDFCNLDFYGCKAMFHILGGHKQNKSIIEQLERVFLRKYPLLYKEILSLFPEQNIRLNKNVFHIVPTLSAERSIAQYEDFINRVEKEWDDIPIDTIFELNVRAGFYVNYASENQKYKIYYTFECNPFVKFFFIPKEWHPWAIAQIKKRLNIDDKEPLSCIALIPTYSNSGVKEHPISEMEYFIYDTIRKNKKLQINGIIARVLKKECLSSSPTLLGIRRHITLETEYLLRNGIIICDNNNN